ncbi:glycosyltransferase [Rhodobacteraceae bacterium 2CG4]|uniref:Glycosyltransferase n=1 Tax=Halovulum marinum TaxID=2662447 RepID=A0A6L5Z3Q2_9RHOB|nr:glycosyltransferase [Halovulum marinum]MSU90642.1 glycosyltransferase [Halovulum marinum]
MTSAPPAHVLLAIPSFRRPEGLARLLDAIARLQPPGGCRLAVQVIDNSPEGGAMAQVAARAGGFPFRLSVLHEPRQGLSRVRNAALDAALAGGFEALAFIDDDEAPRPGWLRAHLDTLAATGADASLGAVHADWTAAPPAWVRTGGFLEQRGRTHRAPVPDAASSNILLRLAPVRRAGLRFDPGYDLTGGEDTAFFAAYARAGGRIVFAADAIVDETVPPHRATLRWLWRRWRRTGETSARIALAAGGGRGRALAGGIVRLAAGGALALGALPLARLGRPALWARGLRIAARGVGFMGAARGRLTAEYAAPER